MKLTELSDIEEIKSGDKLDEQLVKQLTSGIGKMVARFLYANSFEFKVRCKFWLASNYENIKINEEEI